jgi:hypothetical protein
MIRKLIVASLLCATLALAQGGKGSRNSSKMGDNMGAAPMGPPTRFEDIAGALNLNRDQRKTARTILEDGAKEAAPLRDQLSKSRVSVGEAVTANKGMDDLKQIAKTSSELAVQISQLEIKAFVKIFGLLDDTQKQDMRGLGRALSLANEMYHIKNWNDE